MDPLKRRLYLNLRRRVRLQRRMRAVRRDGDRITYECLECGKQDATQFPGVHAARLTFRWHTKHDSVAGTCKRCLKAQRDKLYPLREEKEKR